MYAMMVGRKCLPEKSLESFVLYKRNENNDFNSLSLSF